MENQFLSNQHRRILACYGETPESIQLKKAQEAELLKAEESDLEKGGEGSRGGKIIGHTKSGKPIYAEGPLHNANGTGWNAKNYTSEDHKDAEKIHENYAKDLRKLHEEKSKNQREARKNNDLKAHKTATKERSEVLRDIRRAEENTGLHREYATKVPDWLKL